MENNAFEKTLELTGVIGLGFLVFTVITGHVGFVLGLPVTGLTLPVALVLYTAALIFLHRFVRGGREWGIFAGDLAGFIMLTIVLGILAVTVFSRSYDTSWDGEGYHSNAIISFARGWNPVYQKNLPLKFPDASIFVKGYPKALWLIQASIYLAAGDFDAAKVTNMAIILLALIFSYVFMRRMKLSIPVSLLIAFTAVLHPPFLVQLFSYSADLFSYETALIAIAAFGMFAREGSVNKNTLTFVLAELMLAGSKFSSLPLAAVLGSLYLIVFVVARMDTELRQINWRLMGVLTAASVVFLAVPYLTNIIHYKHPFYPSNYASVNSTFRADNVPSNLTEAPNTELLFYSIFSRSQRKPMGKADPQNIAELKLPFTFSTDEIKQGASIYNNRVGAAGPLFSGIFLLSVILLVAIIFRREAIGSHANLSVASLTGLVAVCIAMALFNPVPNLLRYNIQIVLIPPAVFIFALIFFRQDSVLRKAAYLGLFLLTINMLLFSSGIVWKNTGEQAAINRQLLQLRQPGYRNIVWANNFYSNYLRLDEAGISYEIDKNIGCKNMQFLAYSSYTTRICRIRE